MTGPYSYSLTRQFRNAFGTSPYRYLVTRRLDQVRAHIAQGIQLTDAALLAGISDQAHMSRRFKANYEISLERWLRLMLKFD